MKMNEIYKEDSYVGNGVIIARGRTIEDLIENLSFEQMIFYQIQARLPSDKEEKMMRHYLVSLCEHADTSPSTHPARVISNIGTDFSGAAIGFVAGASGKYHFGALERAMTEISYIADNIKDITSYVEGKLEKKERIWGFGHRFHKTDKAHDLPPQKYELLHEKKDPRVKKLIEIADNLNWNGINLGIVRELGKILYEKKSIPINIDGVGAGILLDMKFPSEISLLFPILGRLSMIARYHLLEQSLPKNRFVALVDKTDPRYAERTVDLEQKNYDALKRRHPIMFPKPVFNEGAEKKSE